MMATRGPIAGGMGAYSRAQSLQMRVLRGDLWSGKSNRTNLSYGMAKDRHPSTGVLLLG